MIAATRCPDSTRLKALLDGTLPPIDERGCAAHLDQCPDCQSALERLAAGESYWNCMVHHLRRPTPLPEPALHLTLDRLTQVSASPTTSAEKAVPEIKLDFLDPPVEPWHLGRLGDYQVMEVLGRGGMGIVLKAFDPALNRVVAIKVMAPQLAASPLSHIRFTREAQSAALIHGEHVVVIHTVGEIKNLPYLVMEYVAGKSLEEQLAAGPLPAAEIIRIALATAKGLVAAHAKGLIHRDIKPANILIEDVSGKVKITDFGLARLAERDGLTQSGTILGTPEYMAPEQADGGEVDHRADLFSLGSVLYAMCTGRPPFAATTPLAVLRLVVDTTPTPIALVNPDVPAWLIAVYEKLHAKKPGDRFQSAEEVVRVLEQPCPDVKSAARSRRMSKRLVYALAAVLLVSVAAAAFHYGPSLYREKLKQAEKIMAVVTNDRRLPAKILLQLFPGPTGMTLAHTPAGESVVGLFDSMNHPIGKLEGHTGALTCIAFSADGTRAITGSQDRTARVWDVTKQKSLFILGPHDNAILAVAMSPDGKTAVTCDGSTIVHVWDLATGNLVGKLRHDQAIGCVAISPDGAFACCGADVAQGPVKGENLHVWDLNLNSKTKDLTVPGGPTTLAYSPDGERLVAWTGKDSFYVAERRDWSTVEVSMPDDNLHDVQHFSFAPGGQVIAMSSKNRTMVWSFPSGPVRKMIRLHRVANPVAPDPETPASTNVLDSSGANLWSMMLRPDGSLNSWKSVVVDWPSALETTKSRLSPFGASEPFPRFLDGKDAGTTMRTGFQLREGDYVKTRDDKTLAKDCTFEFLFEHNPKETGYLTLKFGDGNNELRLRVEESQVVLTDNGTTVKTMTKRLHPGKYLVRFQKMENFSLLCVFEETPKCFLQITESVDLRELTPELKLNKMTLEIGNGGTLKGIRLAVYPRKGERQ